MSICQHFYNMPVKQCAFYLYLPFSTHRFTDMLYKFRQKIIFNDFTENLFNDWYNSHLATVQTPWFVNYVTRDIMDIANIV